MTNHRQEYIKQSDPDTAHFLKFFCFLEHSLILYTLQCQRSTIYDEGVPEKAPWMTWDWTLWIWNLNIVLYFNLLCKWHNKWNEGLFNAFFDDKYNKNRIDAEQVLVYLKFF